MINALGQCQLICALLALPKLRNFFHLQNACYRLKFLKCNKCPKDPVPNPFFKLTVPPCPVFGAESFEPASSATSSESPTTSSRDMATSSKPLTSSPTELQTSCQVLMSSDGMVQSNEATSKTSSEFSTTASKMPTPSELLDPSRTLSEVSTPSGLSEPSRTPSGNSVKPLTAKQQKRRRQNEKRLKEKAERVQKVEKPAEKESNTCPKCYKSSFHRLKVGKQLREQKTFNKELIRNLKDVLDASGKMENEKNEEIRLLKEKFALLSTQRSRNHSEWNDLNNLERVYLPD